MIPLGELSAVRRSARPIATTMAAAVIVVALIAVALSAPIAEATTIAVDVNGGGDYSSIFLGLYWSSEGDTILVYPGVYTGTANRELTMPDHDLTLMSRDGPIATTLNLESHPGILVDQSQTTATVIDGFTIKSGGIPVSPYSIRVENGAGCTIRNCRILERTTLEITGTGSVVVSGCEFAYNNDALRMDDPGTVTVRGCLFRENSMAANLWALYHTTHDVRFVGCDFTENVRCLYLKSDASVVVDSCSFSHSAPGYYSFETGTSVFVTTWPHAYVQIMNCSFTDNHSSRDSGAVEVTAYDGYVELSDCLFADNQAVNYAGAIRNKETLITVKRCTFLRNTARVGGAIVTGVDDDFGLASVVDCVFEENEAAEGGAIAALNRNNAISGCEFRGNRADMGGAIFGRDNRVTVSECLFVGNTGHIWGGGVCAIDVRTGSAVQIEDSTFDGNIGHRGSDVLLDHSIGSVRGCTLFGSRSDDASMVFTRASSANVDRCVASFAASGVPLVAELSSDVDITNCVVFGNAGGDSMDGPLIHPSDNLFSDPLLCNIAASDFTVCANSPCLPENNSWSVQIGAHGAGCDACDSPVEITSWGAIKAMYR